MIWDCREASRWDGERGVAVNSPVMVMENAHKYISNATESARKRRKQVCSPRCISGIYNMCIMCIALYADNK